MPSPEPNKRMQTILITGTDWTGPRDTWHQQPYLRNGELKHHRNNEEDWKNLLFEGANLGRATGLAIGIRGAYTDWRELEWAIPLIDAYRNYQFDDVGGLNRYMLALGPWFDTVGLPDMVNPPGYPVDGTQTRFDFGNDEHIRRGVEHYARVFFDIIREAQRRGGSNPIRLLRSTNGRVLCSWHGISSGLGYGFVNQHLCQRLLDAVDDWLIANGFGQADHVVDAEWKTFAPGLRVYGLNKWFTLKGAHPSYEIVTHGHVTTAVVIPSFNKTSDPTLPTVPSDGGETLRLGLRRAREAGANLTYIEGLTDFDEGAQVMRLADGSQKNLDALREHMHITNGNIEEQPQTGDIMGLMHLAVSTTPLTLMQTGVLVKSTLGKNRYAMLWTQKAGSNLLVDGKPDPLSKTFLCVNDDGTVTAKGPTTDEPNWKPDEWESSQEVEPGDTIIRWFTQNAGKDKSHCVMFILQQFAE